MTENNMEHNYQSSFTASIHIVRVKAHFIGAGNHVFLRFDRDDSNIYRILNGDEYRIMVTPGTHHLELCNSTIFNKPCWNKSHLVYDDNVHFSNGSAMKIFLARRGSYITREKMINCRTYDKMLEPGVKEHFTTSSNTRKQSEGKHYNVAISHAVKKLVRVIYALKKSEENYRRVT